MAVRHWLPHSQLTSSSPGPSGLRNMRVRVCACPKSQEEDGEGSAFSLGSDFSLFLSLSLFLTLSSELTHPMAGVRGWEAVFTQQELETQGGVNGGLAKVGAAAAGESQEGFTEEVPRVRGLILWAEPGEESVSQEGQQRCGGWCLWKGREALCPGNCTESRGGRLGS